MIFNLHEHWFLERALNFFSISPTANASSLSTPGVSALQPGAECGLEFAVGAIMKFRI
jgi:hypothetical protein